MKEFKSVIFTEAGSDKNNNKYFYYPHGEDSFKSQARKDGGCIVIGLESNGNQVYRHERNIRSIWKQTIKNNIETMSYNKVKLGEHFHNCSFYVVPKSCEKFLV